VTRPDDNAPEGPAQDEPEDILAELQPSEELQPAVTLLQDRFEVQDPLTAAARTLHAVYDAAFPGAPPPAVVRPPVVRLPRDAEALNDYEQRARIVYGAFPATFILGSGMGPGQGPLELGARRFLLRHFSRRPARDQQLLAYLHNVKFRADAGRTAAASVRTDARPLRAFLEQVNKPGMDERLSAAIADPKGEDAQRLVKLLAPVIMIAGAKIPFSPLERGTRA
jgi:hypothetical protein